MKMSGNTILITGGTSGLGLKFAKQLLSLGNTVIITGRNAAKLEQTQKQLPGVHPFQSDVGDPKDIASLYEKVTGQFPALNILINNAGEMRKLNLLDGSADLENITREIDINLSGPIRMTQQFLPHLRIQNRRDCQRNFGFGARSVSARTGLRRDQIGTALVHQILTRAACENRHQSFRVNRAGCRHAFKRPIRRRCAERNDDGRRQISRHCD